MKENNHIEDDFEFVIIGIDGKLMYDLEIYVSGSRLAELGFLKL